MDADNEYPCSCCGRKMPHKKQHILGNSSYVCRPADCGLHLGLDGITSADFQQPEHELPRIAKPSKDLSQSRRRTMQYRDISAIAGR